MLGEAVGLTSHVPAGLLRVGLVERVPRDNLSGFAGRLVAELGGGLTHQPWALTQNTISRMYSMCGSSAQGRAAPAARL